MTLSLVQYVYGRPRLGNAGLLREKPKNAGLLWAGVIFAMAALAAIFYFLWDYRDYVLLFGTVGVFTWLLRKAKDSVETKRIWAIIAFFVFAMLFWAGFEQAGSSLTLFADRFTNNSIFGWQFPTSYYQTANPLFVVLLAPFFAWMWVKLGNRAPSSPTKFMLGLVFLSVGFVIIAGASVISAQGNGSR